jgi:hypothetical protein
MRRRGRAASAAVVLMAAAACAAPASETEPLPLQDSAIVVADDVRDDATVVAEYAVTEEELIEIQAACADAEAVPLEDGEACVRIMEIRFDECTPPFEYCLRVYDAENLDASYAGWAEVVEGETDGTLCEDGPSSVCLRVGLTPEALRVVAPGPTDPTTTTPSPTETSPTTGTPSPTPTDTTSSASTGEPSDAATD